MGFTDFCLLSESEVLEKLSSNLERGLSQQQALKLLAENGPNDLKKNEVKWWQILLRQFKSSFVYLLIIAAILALILGEKVDAILIASFIFINSILGFIQEYRSESTIKSLKKFTQGKARVRRDGVERTIVNSELVLGDIVVLETGDIIPADIRLLKINNFLVDESVLTGESVQVSKIGQKLDKPVSQPYQAQNIVFKGTSVLNGKAEGIVVSTGKETEIGKISRLISETKKESAFQKNINKISKFIIWLVVATLFIIIVINYFIIRNNTRSFVDLIIFAIALTVGVIPEALPVVTTFCLSSSARKLANQGVVVKRLTSIEDLGSIQVLCTDKTGTITQNKLTVSQVLTVNENTDPVFIASLAISNIFEKESLPNNSFDLALLAKLEDAKKTELSNYSLVYEIPFDPNRRRNSVLVKRGGDSKLIVRGSPEEMVNMDVHISKEEKESILAWIKSQGELGRRTFGISIADWNSSSEYTEQDEANSISICGIISFIDELKPTTKDVVAQAKSLGVRIVVLTGDDPVIAGAVASEASIIEKREDVLTGAEFDNLSKDEKISIVKRLNVFARVSPKQKFEIIQLLQESYLVGFLGEGINDAPALKIANVSLVVESASDIARETSDIVLLKHDLGVIIDGIVEGRKAFAKTVTYIRATILSNFGNFFAMAFASFIIPYLPMLAVQILTVNLLSDFPMISISTDNVSIKDLKNPKNYNTKDIIIIALLLGIVSTLFDFIMFGTFQRFGEGILQTSWFVGSIATELVLLFSIRTNKIFFKANARPSNTIIILSVVALLITVALPFTGIGVSLFHFVRPSLAHLGILFLIVLGYFLTTEFVKNLYYRFIEHN
jgi:ATPase, P-type (transporting), HAD superfamily, subfamily IC/ATPase, P-type (transporting), HAD superfamily, subfamily IC